MCMFVQMIIVDYRYPGLTQVFIRIPRERSRGQNKLNLDSNY